MISESTEGRAFKYNISPILTLFKLFFKPQETLQNVSLWEALSPLPPPESSNEPAVVLAGT